MPVPTPAATPWLMLVLTLPSKNASARVDIWRRLKRYGALSLRTSGYVLPNTPDNLERFEWVATEIRKYKGQASVAHVQSFDDLPHERMVQHFVADRNKHYEGLIRELKGSQKRKVNTRSLRRRLQEVAAVDFFKSPMRAKVESMIDALDKNSSRPQSRARRRAASAFVKRTWVTRHRPGIDRCASAWFIQRFIDPNANFAFATDGKQIPEGIPFDMFGSDGFGHRGTDCTFETLCKEFSMKNAKVRAIAEIVHDADLHDEKYGRPEGAGIDRILKGWAKQQISDEELLRRGMELIEGLYEGIQ